MFEYKPLLKERTEQQERLTDLQAKREHLKRQYLRFYQMKKKVKDKQTEERVEKYKRQILRMLGRE